MIYALLSIILLYCGMLSASKSFVLVFACLMLFWIPLILRNGTMSNRIQILLGVVAAIVIVTSSSTFRSLLQVIDTRFSYNSSMSDLTTGRTELWKNYITELMENITLLLFGQGYTNVLVNERASHNSIIQMIYQFGIIGVSFVLSWMYYTIQIILPVFKKNQISLKYIALMCVGVMLPWMGIDIVQFDEFFLLPIFAVSGIAYTAQQNELALN